MDDGIDAPGDVSELLLVDQRFDAVPGDERVVEVPGDFGAAAVLDASLAAPVDIAFHLASVPGAQAEADPVLGARVNLYGTMALLERLADQSAGGGPVPRVVFASSVAVYGTSLQAPLADDAPTQPVTSYGTHKLVAEQLLADWTRRRQLDGRSLRLPGIVARPGISAGHGSAFMSAIFRAAEIGNRYTCPVSPSATAWWMSRACCVDNLLHAARLVPERLPAKRVWTVPTLHLAVRTVVDALTRRFGDVRIDFAPVEDIERLFGRQPPWLGEEARAAGFTDDGSVDLLVERALMR
ncbi:hypothetical protein Busp01_30710 [Trinickia caryophylli]|nr:hypothetical protein Busp01_30710 [Trinickia caryophylli]